MTPTARPRFRTDLVAEPIEDGGHLYVDVVDPDTGTGFRFFEVEYSLACAMDGERDVAGLVQWAREDLGIEPSAKELATVISTLGELGYLDGRPAELVGAGGLDLDLALAPGVVASPRAVASPVDDVELGHAEAHVDRAEPIVAGDFELGHAGGAAPRGVAPVAYGGGPELGASGSQRGSAMEFDAPTPPPAEMPSAKLRPSSRPDAEDDGPTNLPGPAISADFDDDVSVDLSDHLAISASDVKEAVRASRTMKAVEIPADLAAQLDDSSDAQQERLTAAREAAERGQAERLAAERAAVEAARPPVELPRPPVGVSRPRSTSERPVDQAPTAVAKEVPTAVPVPVASTGARRWLILLLVLAAAAAGAWYYRTKVQKKPLPWETAAEEPVTGTGSAADQLSGGPGSSTGSVVVTPPPPPPPPSAALAELAGVPADVAAGQIGIVASVIGEGSIVAAGDELVRFRGNAAAENKLVGLDYDIDQRVPKQIADATAARDKATAAGQQGLASQHEATIGERQKRLAEKTAERDQIRGSMAALSIKAPVSGTVAAKIAKGARTAADQVVATVTPLPVLSATFTLPSGWTGKTPAADASVRVAMKTAPEQQANCTVTAVALPQITVTCPADGGIAVGTEIILE